MRKRNRVHQLSLCLGGIALAGIAQQAHAQISVDGSLDAGYGSALATQTINTGFGDSVIGDGTSGGGSELDAAYGVVQNGTLYVFLAGNYENTGNHINLFVADGRTGGQAVLNASSSSGPLSAMNGSVFSPGFAATYAIDANDYSNTLYLDQYDLVNNTANYSGSVPLTGGIGNNQNLSGLKIGFNNTNIAGVNGTTGTAADPTAADAVKTGLEIGIPLSALGNPAAGSNIEVLADINGGGDGYLSNQFLPGLPVGTSNIGAGGPYTGAGAGSFDLSSIPNDWFSVNVPSLPNGTWLAHGSGNWGDGTNWANGVVPQNPGDSASFATATANSTVSLNTAWSVGSLSFSDSFSYNLAPGTAGSLKMDNGANGATITDYGGMHTISAPVVLNSTTTITVVSHGDNFTISGNITGNGGLSIVDPGEGSPVILSGANSYLGGTSVIGNLQLDSAGALPVGTALTLSAVDLPSGVLDLNGNSATVSSITVPTGPNTQTVGSVAQIINTSATAGTSTFTYAGVNTNPSTFIGNIVDNSGSAGGTTALTIASGSLTLSGNNTYGGATTVNTGATLVLSTTPTTNGTTISLPTGGAVTNNGTLEVSSAENAGNISGSGTTTVDATGVLTAVNFTQASMANNGSATIVGSGTVGPISGAGTLTIGGTLHLAASSGGSAQGGLVINSGGTLDIANNHFIINYGATADPAPTIYTLLQSGYNGGAWTGTGIDSATAALSANKAHYGVGFVDGADNVPGASVTSGQIEIAYALYGDVNLDGLVNATDFAVFGANFNKAITGWDHGDFTYTGLINGSDFALLGSNFGKSASGTAISLPAGDYAALDAFAAANGLSLPTSVPEPASLGLLTLGVLLRRRRRASVC